MAATGGANRASVVAAIEAGSQSDNRTAGSTAASVLAHLESLGYRVVRAGMVPRVEELDQVADHMQLVRDSLSGKVHDFGATNVVDSITALRELAINVLGLDVDDVDDVDVLPSKVDAERPVSACVNDDPWTDWDAVSVGDRDPTGGLDGPRCCRTRLGGYVCTRDQHRAMPHVAGDGDTVAAVWR